MHTQVESNLFLPTRPDKAVTLIDSQSPLIF